jgi:hypothetical protein
MKSKGVQNDGQEFTEQEIREMREENREKQKAERNQFQERIVKDGSISTMI